MTNHHCAHCYKSFISKAEIKRHYASEHGYVWGEGTNRAPKTEAEILEIIKAMIICASTPEFERKEIIRTLEELVEYILMHGDPFKSRDAE